MIVANQVYYFYNSGGIAPPVEPPAIVGGGAVDSRASWRRTRIQLTSIGATPSFVPGSVTASARVSLRTLAEYPILGRPVVRGATSLRLPGSFPLEPSLNPGVFRAGSRVRLPGFESLMAQGALKARGEIHIPVRYRGRSFSAAMLLGKPRVWIGPDLVKMTDEELLDILLFME